RDRECPVESSDRFLSQRAITEDQHPPPGKSVLQGAPAIFHRNNSFHVHGNARRRRIRQIAKQCLLAIDKDEAPLVRVIVVNIEHPQSDALLAESKLQHIAGMDAMLVCKRFTDNGCVRLRRELLKNTASASA